MSFIDEYVEYASEFTDSPAVMHHRIAMTIISTVVNRNAWLSQGFKRLYPNLWTLIIAPSSFYRKSHSISIAEDLIREVSPSLLLPKEFSHEKLIEVIMERPQGLMIFYEFRTFLGLMSKDYMAGTKSFITEMFDSPNDYDRLTKAKEIKISNPFLNILSASTIDWLKTSIKDDDVAGGFLPRFLMVLAPKKEKTFAFQPIASQTKRFTLIKKLKAMKDTSYGEMIFTPEAISYYTEWYTSYEKKHENRSGSSAFLTRLQDYAKKIAIILNIDRGIEKEISVETCRLVCALVDSYAANALQVLEGSLFESRDGKTIDRIKGIVKESGETGISREILYKKAHLLAKDLEQVIHTLAQSGNLKAKVYKSEHPTGTKTKTVYYWEENGYEV